MGRYMFRGEMEPTCHKSQARLHHQARPTLQVRPALPRATSSLSNTSFPMCTTWMNEIDEGNVGVIEWMKLWSLGSMGPPLRPINHHNHHSKSILSITKRRRFIPWHRGEPPHLEGRPHLPTAILAKTNVRNQPPTASGARIKSVQVKRWWIIGLAAPPHTIAPMKMGPRPQPTPLTYKRSLTPAGSHTPR
jgi:hypothetical protein